MAVVAHWSALCLRHTTAHESKSWVRSMGIRTCHQRSCGVNATVNRHGIAGHDRRILLIELIHVCIFVLVEVLGWDKSWCKRCGALHKCIRPLFRIWGVGLVNMARHAVHVNIHRRCQYITLTVTYWVSLDSHILKDCRCILHGGWHCSCCGW